MTYYIFLNRTLGMTLKKLHSKGSQARNWKSCTFYLIDIQKRREFLANISGAKGDAIFLLIWLRQMIHFIVIHFTGVVGAIYHYIFLLLSSRVLSCVYIEIPSRYLIRDAFSLNDSFIHILYYMLLCSKSQSLGG